MLPGGFGGVRSGVALIHIRHLDGASGDLLDLRGQCGDLLPVALVGRRHGQRQQVAQRVDRDVDLRSFAPLGPVVACPRTRLGRGLKRTAVDADRSRLALAPAPLAPQRANILHQQLETAGLEPALHLLVHHPPGTKLARQKTPLSARTGHVAHRVEHPTQIMLPLRAVLTAQQEIRQHERPLLVRHITRIPFKSFARHLSMLGKQHRHAKTLTRYKVPNSL